MNQLLKQAGMEFTDVRRMWNYLDGLLGWYDEFNKVRTTFFKEHGIFDNEFLPTATGIGAANYLGAAYVGNLLAIKPKDSHMKLKEVFSPLQCPAHDYSSSFSRATSVDSEGIKQLYISGTASIEQGGATICVDDVVGQIEVTIEVISEILKNENMCWGDISDSIAYFTDLNDIEKFHDHLEKLEISHFPVTYVHADICRNDLLFELELHAVKELS
jgi:enamine deaminase RidA (YjgF/YER057c/UK114 family)